jgi:hypothetical protein
MSRVPRSRFHRIVQPVEVGLIGDASPHRAGIPAEVSHGLVERFLPAAVMKTKAPSSMNRLALARPCRSRHP